MWASRYSTAFLKITTNYKLYKFRSCIDMVSGIIPNIPAELQKKESRLNENLQNLLLTSLFACLSCLNIVIWKDRGTREPAHREPVYACNENGTSLPDWG